MSDKFKRDFILKTFSTKVPEPDKMVTEILQTLASLPPYSNAQIAKIQQRVLKELKNQKDRAKNQDNFESYLKPREV